MAKKRQALRAAIAYINSANPSLPDLIRLLDRQEREMKARAQAVERAEDRAPEREPEPEPESPFPTGAEPVGTAGFHPRPACQ